MIGGQAASRLLPPTAAAAAGGGSRDLAHPLPSGDPGKAETRVRTHVCPGLLAAASLIAIGAPGPQWTDHPQWHSHTRNIPRCQGANCRDA